MTHSKKIRRFMPTLTVAMAIAAGAAQAQEWPRTVPLCQLEEEWPLTQRLTDRLFAREDFDTLLRYSSQNCPNVALLLTDGATAAIPGTAAPAPAAPAAGPGDDLRRVPLCRLEEEMPLPRGVVNQIVAREDFDDLLRYASDNCPEVALLLTDLPTATIPEDTGGGMFNGVDEEGPEDRGDDTLPGGDGDDTQPGGDDTQPGGDDSQPGGNDSQPGGDGNGQQNGDGNGQQNGDGNGQQNGDGNGEQNGDGNGEQNGDGTGNGPPSNVGGLGDFLGGLN